MVPQKRVLNQTENPCLQGRSLAQNSSKVKIFLMTLRRQKVTEQGKMCMFSTKIIENRALQYLRIMKNFPAVIGSTRLQLQLQQSFLHYVPMA